MSAISPVIKTSDNTSEPNPIPNGSINGLSCKVVDRTLETELTLASFPDEMKVEILKQMDLPALKQLRYTDREWSRLALDHQVWSPIATRIGCPISDDPYSQVRSFTEYLLQKAANIPDRKPDDIVRILSAKSPTIDEINRLQNWLKARDTLVLWKELITGIRGAADGLGLDGLNTSQEVMDKAREFSTWCTDHDHELAHLFNLELSDLHLTYLPPQIGKLTGLRGLNLSHNKLSSLPTEIGKLTSLRGLNLSHNKLSSLSPEIGKLTGLRGLQLQGNNLSSLPPEIGKLTELGTLSLKANNLSSLPTEMSNLGRLRNLTINEEHRTLLPKELLNRPGLEINVDRAQFANQDRRAATAIEAVALTAAAVAAYYFGPSVVETLSPYVFSALGI